MKAEFQHIKSRGFTIIELLIVIVIIAILAALVIVAYIGIQQRAGDSSRFAELKAWQKQFQLYAAQENGTFPIMPNGAYCLGVGFPNSDGSGLGNCRDLGWEASRHTVSPALNTELAKVGTLPNGPRKGPGKDGSLGPYVTYNTTQIILTNIFAGSCPAGTVAGYSYGDARMCTITLTKP